MYKDRQGRIIVHDATPDKALKLMYETLPGRIILGMMIQPRFSDLIRKIMKTRFSAIFIDGFARKNHISLKDYIPTRYKSFNDFFTRPIKPQKRPIERNENLLVSPCDGRVTVYPISDRLVMHIKNSDYSVKSLLRNREIAEEFEGGYCVIVRLTVEDYHRYCYPDDGYKSDDMFIPGLLHTVSPIVMEHASIYAENQRVYTVIDTDHFGRMVQVEIGAIGVGRVVNFDDEGPVKRGDEKGMFEFGGSTIVLLLQKGCFIPDADIIKNTEDGFETIVKMGERIGSNEKYQG